ncbi:hypothetical protein [Paraconexibacter sp.]|uniref:hypothetical protein n=1 Tax=Paraconexibacter sp. TaxID=2949640 RepID=UPI003569B0E3
MPIPTSSLRSERICVWCGLALVVLLGVGFVLAGLVPPPSPASSGEQIRDFYAENADLKRVGIILLSVGGSLFLPFGVAVAAQLRRIEGPGSPAAYVQLGAATITAATTIIYTFMMLTLAYRPDGRSPDVMLALNDLAWLPFVGVWSPGALQAAAVAVAIFADRRPPGERILPRWLGWVSAWMAFTSLTGSLVPFFTDGPFAWNGLIGFYVAATVFLGWYLAVFTVLLRTTAPRVRGAAT